MLYLSLSPQSVAAKGIREHQPDLGEKEPEKGIFKMGYIVNCVCGGMSHPIMVEKEIYIYIVGTEVWVWDGTKEAHF